jgi:ABC-2 type transport system permease protein
MRSFIAFVRKEFCHILRDRRTMLILLVMPIVEIILFGFAISTEVKNVRVAVLDPSHDVATHRITDRLNAGEYFTVRYAVQSPGEMDELFRLNKTDLAVVFGPNFADRLYAGEAEVQLLADATDPNMATLQTNYATQTIREAIQTELKEGHALGETGSASIDVAVKLLYNPQMKSAYNFVPGVMGLIMMLICAMMTSISIVREKEMGTMELLLASPVRPVFVILSKVVPYFVLSVVNLATILALSVFVLDVSIAGSLFWLVAVSLLFIFVALALGILISSIVRTQVAAMLGSGLALMMPTVLLSGMIFPVESMPAPLQWISALIPARWYIDLVKRIMIQGVDITQVGKPIAVLAVMAVALISISLRKFKNRLEGEKEVKEKKREGAKEAKEVRRGLLLPFFSPLTPLTSSFLIEKEFKQLFRNAFLPKLIFIFPVFMMILLPWAATMEVKGVRLNVVDNDHSPLSGRLIRKIAVSDFKLNANSASYEEAMKAIESGTADVIMEIAPHFERDLMRGEAGRVQLTVNTVNGAKGSLGSAYLSTIIRNYEAELREAPPSSPLPSFPEQMRFNPNLNYKRFIVPALMVMLLTLLCGFLPALNVVSEKEKGTIEQINVTPVSRFTFILAKLLPYWAMGFVVLTLCFGLAWLFYGILPAGRFMTIYGHAAIFILTVSGFGLVISNHSATMQQAMFVMFFCMIVFMLMSGLFTPIASMPEWAQVITLFNPLKYMIEVLRGVYLKGAGFSDLLTQLWALMGFAVFFNLWAVVSYRKNR